MSLLNLSRTRELKAPSSRFLKQCAFTLAEVLITLGIIGVVAAMTIPTLMNKINDKNTVVATKKAYSVLSQAYLMAEKENGTPDSWGITAADQSAMLSNLVPYLRVNKNCIDGSTGCFPPGETYKYMAAPVGDLGILDSPSSSPKLSLSDGTLISGHYYGSCTVSRGATPALSNLCGEYWVDVNGFKKPNQVGKDLFYFYLTNQGILPLGTQNDTAVPFSSACRDISSAAGYGCAAWVLYNENLDYLHCSDLAWDGKHKCG